MTPETGVESKRKKPRSREYPAVSLKRAVECARVIFERDRFTVAPAEATARLLGYNGLNGGSRSLLSALRKFGLIDYHGGGDAFQVGLSSTAKALFQGTNPGHEREVLEGALEQPVLYKEILERFPGGEFPSRETFTKVVERDFGIQPKAVPSFIDDLVESVEFVKSFAPPTRVENQAQEAPEANEAGPGRPQSEVTRTGELRVPMPGGGAFISLPDPMTPAEARRIKAWLERVVVPTVDFAATGDDLEEV